MKRIALILVGLVIVLGIGLSITILSRDHEETTLHIRDADLPTSLQPANLNATNVVLEPISRKRILCDEVHVFFRQGTSLARIQQILQAVNGTLVGRDIDLNLYQVRITCTGGSAGVIATVSSLNLFDEVTMAIQVDVLRPY